MARRPITMPNTTATALQDCIAQAQHDARGAVSPWTVLTYASATRAFTTWATAQGLAPTYPYDPRIVATFVDALGDTGRTYNTMRTYVAGLDRAHHDRDLPAPGTSAVVRLALRRLTRTAATKGVRQKRTTPVRHDLIETVLARMGTDLVDLRDAALLSLAYDTSARASELCGFRARDVVDGVATITRRKAVQEGHNLVRHVTEGTMARIAAWIAAAQLAPIDPLFKPLGPSSKEDSITAREVTSIIKRRAGRTFSAHLTRGGSAVE